MQAAAIQALYEDAVLKLMDHYLGDIIRETGRLAFSGAGVAGLQAIATAKRLGAEEAMIVYRRTREKIATSEKSKGQLLDEIFGEENRLGHRMFPLMPIALSIRTAF